MVADETAELQELQRALEQTLLDLYGPVLTGGALSGALGYKTYSGFRQAVLRKSVSVPVFSLPKRKGRFALTIDVAHWLAEQRINSQTNMKEAV